MRSQPAPTTSSAGNRQARRKARKVTRKQRQRIDSAAPAAVPVGTGKLALAIEHVGSGQLVEAELILHDVVQATPDLALARNVLGQLLDKRRCHREAYDHHKRAVTTEPENAQYWSDFGRCLLGLQQADAAIVAFEKAVELQPGNVDTAMALVDALSSAGRFAATLPHLDKIIVSRPDWGVAHCQKGAQLQFLGEFADAKSCFEEALRLDPELIEAYFHLLQIGSAPPDEEAVIARLRTTVERPELTQRRRSIGLFTLAKLYERRNDHDAAFQFCAAANDVLKPLRSLDREEMARFVESLIEGFTVETFEHFRGAGLPSDRPVFIVGMPRSGTTLVETIVSSHSRVFAGGEIRKLPELATELRGSGSEALSYPRDAAKLDPGQLAEIGQLYLTHLGTLAPSAAERVTDKQPANFFHLGLIAVLFPNAVIVSCRRDVMDTCLSCYFQYFDEPGTISYTSDLEDLGFFYGQYKRIMDHWRTVLPTPILDVDYEEVVRDQERTSRRILEFVGLDWEQSCLDFHDNRRGVRTVSMWQVRQPIYTSSVGKWRRYEKHLDPLKAVLAG